MLRVPPTVYNKAPDIFISEPSKETVLSAALIPKSITGIDLVPLATITKFLIVKAESLSESANKN